MTDVKRSDRDMMRKLASDLREATEPKKDESPRAVEFCWDGLFRLLEIKKENE